MTAVHRHRDGLPAPSRAGTGRRRRAAGRASLSPSRAADFKTCPLLFRFRTIDRLPERPTPDQVRGTLVHAVLEHLFDLPAAERTPAAAAALVAPEWARLIEQEPALATLFAETRPPSWPSPARCRPLLSSPRLTGCRMTRVPGWRPSCRRGRSAGRLLRRGGSAPARAGRAGDPGRPRWCDDELVIRGYIDRLDVSPAGDLRVVDYKTGGAPREAFEGRALFQLKFYALVLWRTRGVVPRVLRLLYLKDAEICDYSPDAEELERFERTLLALSGRRSSGPSGDRDFRPQPSRLCGWCSHQAVCPEFGGTIPPYPEPRQPDPEPSFDGATRPGVDPLG